MFWLFHCLRWFPVIFVTAVVGWSYYAYIVIVSVTLIDSVPLKVLYILLYHVVFMMFMLSYWVTIRTKPAEPSEKFRLTEEDEEDLRQGMTIEAVLRRMVLNRKLKVYTRTDSGDFRFCEKCRILKPDRCHHCSISEQCVLKMDHFCPWVNTTVGFSSYKTFFLFLFYTEIFTLYVAMSVLPYFIKFWTQGSSDNDEYSDSDRIQTMFLFFLALLFSLGVLSLFGVHIFLVLNNKTTLESSRATNFHYGKDKNGFSLGWKENLHQVFGPIRWKWFLPVNNSIGDGCEFPLRRRDCQSDQLLTLRLSHIEEGESTE